MVIVKIGMPIPSPDEIHDRIFAAVTAKTRMIVIDHIAPHSAAILPISKIAATARARNIAVLVDGTHGPGLVDIGHSRLGVDWNVGNCHKWLCAPKDAGSIYAARDHKRVCTRPS